MSIYIGRVELKAAQLFWHPKYKKSHSRFLTNNQTMLTVIEGGFVIVNVVVLGLFLASILYHFLPLLFLRSVSVPKGSFGWPFLGETLSFLRPHPSTSIGDFLQYHCSR